MNSLDVDALVASHCFFHPCHHPIFPPAQQRYVSFPCRQKAQNCCFIPGKSLVKALASLGRKPSWDFMPR